MVPLLRFALITIAILSAGYAVPGISVDGIVPALLMAAVMTLVGATVRPILFLLTLPLTVVTFGLFLLVINSMMFWLSAAFVPGVEVHGFLSAVLGSLIVTVFRFVGRWQAV